MGTIYRNVIIDDVNVITKLTAVRENYKSIKVLTMYDVDFII